MYTSQQSASARFETFCNVSNVLVAERKERAYIHTHLLKFHFIGIYKYFPSNIPIARLCAATCLGSFQKHIFSIGV